jgi:hypothetical protein
MGEKDKGEKAAHCDGSIGKHIREGDRRTNAKVEGKKALCILLYALGKSSYKMIGRNLKNTSFPRL